MELDSRSLSHAVALAEHRSFSRAARALGLTQSALSRSIQGLEGGLGVQLFERTSMGVEPTQQGRAFVAHAVSILHGLRVLGREMEGLRDGGLARLALGVGPLQVGVVAIPALARLLRREARLEIDVRIDEPLRLLASLREDVVDVVLAAREHLQDADGVIVLPLREQPLAAFARPAHPLLRQRAIGWKDLFAHPLALTTVTQSHLAWMRDERMRHRGRAGLITCESVTALRELVAATDAIGFEPHALLAEAFERGELVEIPAEQPIGSLHPAVVWLEDRPLSAEARTLVDLILQVDREAGPAAPERPARPPRSRTRATRR
jgi:DNA-binding transcriptional LysR family regulator